MTRDDKSPLNENAGAVHLPKRSRKYGVGKEIGGAVYVHRDYEGVFGLEVAEARRRLPSEFDYTVVKLNLANSTVSFIQVTDFDAAPEPIVGSITVVKQDGSCRHMKPPNDPYIYHHKWLFVTDDYDGFEKQMSPQSNEVAVFTKKGSLPFWSMPSPQRLFLVFGSETKGLPESILAAYRESTYHIPITGEIRCLNLSTAVGIALYESLRVKNSGSEGPTLT